MDQNTQSISQTPPPPKKQSGVFTGILLFVFGILVGLALSKTTLLPTLRIPYLSATPTPTAGMRCVEKSSVACNEIDELTLECTDEYQAWASENCPGWGEMVYCKEPRPEVCTLECVQTPPYICGSTGKSYCSVCQACSDTNVIWYKMRDSNCGEEVTENIPSISESELSRGWYWGTNNQKKPNTPVDWVYTEAGRSSCWHKPGVLCTFLPNQ